MPKEAIGSRPGRAQSFQSAKLFAQLLTMGKIANQRR
jgi:hypothetical protein